MVGQTVTEEQLGHSCEDQLLLLVLPSLTQQLPACRLLLLLRRNLESLEPGSVFCVLGLVKPDVLEGVSALCPQRTELSSVCC